MPHHKSAKKRVKTNEIRRQRNAQYRTKLRHEVRDLRQAIATADSPSEELTQRTNRVHALLDSMATKGLIHRNHAARLKSRVRFKSAE